MGWQWEYACFYRCCGWIKGKGACAEVHVCVLSIGWKWVYACFYQCCDWVKGKRACAKVDVRYACVPVQMRQSPACGWIMRNMQADPAHSCEHIGGASVYTTESHHVALLWIQPHFTSTYLWEVIYMKNCYCTSGHRFSSVGVQGSVLITDKLSLYDNISLEHVHILWSIEIKSITTHRAGQSWKRIGAKFGSHLNIFFNRILSTALSAWTYRWSMLNC